MATTRSKATQRAHTARTHSENTQHDLWRLQINHDHAHSSQPAQRLDQDSAPPFWRFQYALGLLVFGAFAACFLLSEHRAHFFGALPFLLLLACLLMHILMHRGHGGHGGGHGDHADCKRRAGLSDSRPAPETEKPP